MPTFLLLNFNDSKPSTILATKSLMDSYFYLTEKNLAEKYYIKKHLTTRHAQNYSNASYSLIPDSH